MQMRRRYFTANAHYRAYFADTHQGGALDAKTKELIHLALVLALHCEP
jgi:alkylhydroperoxidase/carboxymuconolactone decarboxylase family protein YurZ